MARASDGSNDPFPQIDSNHGPSRDVIAVYLRQLRDGYQKLDVKLEDHKEKTSTALEEIRISLAKTSQSCPRSEQCQEIFKQVDVLRIDREARKGAFWAGRALLIFISSSVGAMAAIIATWYLIFPHGKP
jgi:hypothetical protein